MFKILNGKGIFPYEFIDNIEKLKFDKELKTENFYSNLNNENVSEEYFNYLKVWNMLKEKSLGNYSDLYSIQDVLLLLDKFGSFRNKCLRNYKLDPAYYLTAPSLAWDAILKLTKIYLELVSDYSMYLTIENGIKGGISQVTKRYSKPNNRYVKDYDPTKHDNHLLYIDANNLYRWVLSLTLPYKDIMWVDPNIKNLQEWKR